MQALIQLRIVNCFGMQLLFDPFFQADLANVLHVSGTRAVRQAIHGVQDGFVFGEFRDRKLAFEFLIERDALVSGAGVCGLAFDWLSDWHHRRRAAWGTAAVSAESQQATARSAAPGASRRLPL